MANGVIIPPKDGGWIELLNNSNFTVRYQILNGFVFVYIAVNSESALTGSWQSVVALPSSIVPTYPMFNSLYNISNQFYFNVLADTTGALSVRGNVAVSGCIAYPI